VIDSKDFDVDMYPDEPTELKLTGVISKPAQYGTIKFDADKKSILYVVDPVKTGEMKKGEILVDIFDLETTDSVSYDKAATHKVDNKVTITITGLNDNTPIGTTNLTMVVDEGKDFTDSIGVLDTIDLSTIVTDA